jgi:hypothetical protein
MFLIINFNKKSLCCYLQNMFQVAQSSHTTQISMSDVPELSMVASADDVEPQLLAAQKERPYNLRLRQNKRQAETKKEQRSKKQKVKVIECASARVASASN